MNLIICMAGLNTRFHNVGFDIPKYLLPWNDSVIISEILKNLTLDNVYLIAHKRDEYFKKELIKAISPLGLNKNNLLYIGDTDGQAQTAIEGLKRINLNEGPIFFHNADTILINRKINKISNKLNKKITAYVDIFYGESDKYSYVELNDKNLVKNIKEKKVISKFASSGLYGFQNKHVYLNYYNKLNKKDGELFISDVLKKMIQFKENICVNKIFQKDKTIVLGSPEEYGLHVTRNYFS